MHSVISKLSRSSSRQALSFKDSPVLLNILEVSLTYKSHKRTVLETLQIFMARRKASGRALLCFVHFHCVLIHIVGFYPKQCASDLKDLTFVRLTYIYIYIYLYFIYIYSYYIYIYINIK